MVNNSRVTRFVNKVFFKSRVKTREFEKFAMTICSALKCVSGQPGSSTPVKSFLFIVKSDPARNTQWAKWVQMHGRPNFTPSSTSVLCEKHFTEDQFVPEDQNRSAKGPANKRRKLIPGALPTIFGDIHGKLVKLVRRKLIHFIVICEEDPLWPITILHMPP